MVLELPVESDDALVQLVEDWVTERGLVLFQDAWDDFVVFNVFSGGSEEDASIHFQESEVAGVDTVGVGLDQVSEVFNGLGLGQVNAVSSWSDDVSQVDGFTDATFVVLNLADEFVVLLVVHDVVIVSLGEWNSVVIVQVRVISGLEWQFPGEFRDDSEVVGQAFQVVTGQQLLVMEEIEFSATVLVQSEFFSSCETK